jgi:hypothetical protein
MSNRNVSRPNMAKIGSLVTGHRGLKVSISTARHGNELKGNWDRKHGSEVSAFPDEIP